MHLPLAFVTLVVTLAKQAHDTLYSCASNDSSSQGSIESQRSLVMRSSSPSLKERMISSTRQENADTRLRGSALWLCRASWTALALGILRSFFAGLPVYISNFQRVCPGHNCAAGQLAPESVRVPPILASGAGSYPTYMVVFQLVSA